MNLLMLLFMIIFIKGIWSYCRHAVNFIRHYCEHVNTENLHKELLRKKELLLTNNISNIVINNFL